MIYYLLEGFIECNPIKEKLKEFKYLLQISLNQKSIKISKDGRIDIVFRFKPNEFLVTDDIKKLEDALLSKLKVITNTNFKITRMQKEPSSCYNIYVRLFNVSDERGKDRVKRFLRYFEKTKINTFIKKSYCEIHIFAKPLNLDEFNKFLYMNES